MKPKLFSKPLYVAILCLMGLVCLSGCTQWSYGFKQGQEHRAIGGLWFCAQKGQQNENGEGLWRSFSLGQDNETTGSLWDDIERGWDKDVHRVTTP